MEPKSFPSVSPAAILAALSGAIGATQGIEIWMMVPTGLGPRKLRTISPV